MTLNLPPIVRQIGYVVLAIINAAWLAGYLDDQAGQAALALGNLLGFSLATAKISPNTPAAPAVVVNTTAPVVADAVPPIPEHVAEEAAAVSVIKDDDTDTSNDGVE